MVGYVYNNFIYYSTKTISGNQELYKVVLIYGYLNKGLVFLICTKLTEPRKLR